MFLDGENTPQLESPSLTILNAGVRWTLPNDRLAVSGARLEPDRRARAHWRVQRASFFGYVEGYYNPPRQYWVSVNYRSK